MKTSLKKLERSVKTDRTCVLIIAVIVIIGVIGTISNVVSLLSKEPSEFSVRVEKSETFGIETTYLDVNGEEYSEIFTDYYKLLDDNGKTNYQAIAVIEEIGTIVQYVLMAVITILVYMLFKDCKNLRTPFTKKSVTLLRWIAVLIMAAVLLPEFVCLIITMVVFSYASFEIPASSVFVILLGAVFGMIAEIFKYGTELQEDSDSIA